MQNDNHGPKDGPELTTQSDPEVRPDSVARADASAAARRSFLAFLGGTTALLVSGSANAAPSKEQKRLLAKKKIVDVWGYSENAKSVLTTRAKQLTLSDLDSLREGRATKNTKAVTWKDLSSLVDGFGRQYGMNRHPFNPSGSMIAGTKPAAGSCCCCCTCCCGDCTFSIDCKESALKAK